MAIIKLEKAGVFNSVNKVGNWSVPQEMGDDIPKGTQTYDSLQIQDLFRLKGEFVRKVNGFEIKHTETPISGNSLSKGLISIKGHLFELEEDTYINESFFNGIVIGINRNTDGSETERSVYLDLSKDPNTVTQEELTVNSGIYEIGLYDEDLNYILPNSDTINDYKDVLLQNIGGKLIYDVELPNISTFLISNPSLYYLDNISITLNFNEIFTETTNIHLRIRKGNSYLDVLFDNDLPILGKNTLFFYREEDGTILTTTGRAK